ncbi:MAG: hypothetical protein PHX47_03035 [Candidatus ainarchaeum sp.]|jgi:hypothetical protein|nr:hypothetical protein [Candidatus ainarchaeum sp.]
MSLYKENKFDFLKNKYIWIIIGAILVLAILGYLLTMVNWKGMFEKDNIKVKFQNNPLIVSEKDNTLIEITLINNTEKDLDNLEVTIKDVENNFEIFCPDSQEDKTKVIIPKMASGNERIITCNVRYDPTKDFFEGTYSFDIDYSIEDYIYTKRANLEVRR